MEGTAYLQVNIGKNDTPLDLFVTKNLNRNIILGCDLLKQNRVRIYFDLRDLRINNEYVALAEDKHISSIVRLDNPVVPREDTN